MCKSFLLQPVSTPLLPLFQYVYCYSRQLITVIVTNFVYADPTSPFSLSLLLRNEFGYLSTEIFRCDNPETCYNFQLMWCGTRPPAKHTRRVIMIFDVVAHCSLVTVTNCCDAQSAGEIEGATKPSPPHRHRRNKCCLCTPCRHPRRLGRP